MNVFDLVVTVSLGSILATVVVSKDVPLADGATAFAVLIALQFIVTWTSVRVPWIRKLVTGEPVLLLYRGEVIQSALRKTRVAEDEVFIALRAAGMSTLNQARAVVLETDGTLTVVRRDAGAGDSTLEGVRRV
ncbi:MAG: YetF domain-containing protein [Dokdonella sp.]